MEREGRKGIGIGPETGHLLSPIEDYSAQRLQPILSKRGKCHKTNIGTDTADTDSEYGIIINNSTMTTATRIVTMVDLLMLVVVMILC